MTRVFATLTVVVLLFALTLPGTSMGARKHDPRCGNVGSGIVICAGPAPKGARPDRAGHVTCPAGRHAVRVHIGVQLNGRSQVTYWCKPNAKGTARS